MKRRTFISGIVAVIATTFGLKPKVVAQEAQEPQDQNPGFPVVKIGEDGRIANLFDLFDYPSYADSRYHIHLVWMEKESATIDESGRLCWGVMKLAVFVSFKSNENLAKLSSICTEHGLKEIRKTLPKAQLTHLEYLGIPIINNTFMYPRTNEQNHET